MSKYYLGIDVGGTKTKAVLLSGREKQKPKSFEMHTPQNIIDFAKGLEAFIEKVIDDKKIEGVGMALPGVVDGKRGMLVECHNLPFLNGWNAVKFLNRFSRKVAIENDSRAFLLAEMGWGEVRKYKNVLGLTIGTGIGGGIFMDGKPYRGIFDAAGELGKMIIDNGQTLEALANRSAKLSLTERNKYIGQGVANLVNVLNPEAVVVGGGGITSGDIKIEDVRKIALENIPYSNSKKVKILPTKLGYYSSAIGAALLIK